MLTGQERLGHHRKRMWPFLDAGTLASGPAHAALELSLLLTTLQSLSVTPSQAEGGHAPQSTLSTNCHAAMLQLRDWLNQLQHQALPLPEPVSFLTTSLTHMPAAGLADACL